MSKQLLLCTVMNREFSALEYFHPSRIQDKYNCRQYTSTSQRGYKYLVHTLHQQSQKKVNYINDRTFHGKTAWVPNDFRGHPGPGLLQQPLHFLRRLGIIKRLCCRDGSLTTAAAISAGKLSLNGDRDSTLTWWQVWKKHPESLISLGLWSSFLQCPCSWHASCRHLLTLMSFD